MPSEAVLIQICTELSELDLERLLAVAGRVGEGAEEYLKANPTAGVLFRKVSGAGLSEQHLKELLDKADQIIRDRDQISDKQATIKWYPSADGEQRIFYSDDEIEQIADDELARAGLRPTPADPVTDLEKFIEIHLKAELDRYAYLPDDVLGLTQFRAGRPPIVSINAELTGAAVDNPTAVPGLLGRWRATLAYEAMHVLLHRYLFEPDLNQMRLFDPPPVNPVAAGGLMRCLKRDVGPATTPRDWREVQANRGMAALLMPRAVFKRVAFQRMTTNSLADVAVGSPAAATLAADLAARFSVSKQAAAIRLETLRIARPADNTAHLPGL